MLVRIFPNRFRHLIYSYHQYPQTQKKKTLGKRLTIVRFELKSFLQAFSSSIDIIESHVCLILPTSTVIFISREIHNKCYTYTQAQIIELHFLSTCPCRNNALTLLSSSRIANSVSNNAPFASPNFSLQACHRSQ